MFKCEYSGEISQPGEKCAIVVTEKREKYYKERSGVNRPATWKGEKQDIADSTNDPGGRGYEIVKALRVRPKYAAECTAKLGCKIHKSRNAYTIYET